MANFSVEVQKVYGGEVLKEIFDVLSRLKNRNL